MTVVYHWTSELLAKNILVNGLRKWSFVCRSPSDWNGEVCLEIELDKNIDWDNRDEFYKWQAVVPETIHQNNIRRMTPYPAANVMGGCFLMAVMYSVCPF